MAQEGRFFDAETVDGEPDRVYTASDWAAIFDAFLQGGYGVIQGYLNELAVIQSTPAAMTVEVRSGAAFHSGREYGNTADASLVIAANASGSTRVDLIVVQFDLDDRIAEVAVHQGTPGAGTPAATLTSTILEIPLAAVTVANGATSIVTANIADARTYLGLLTYVASILNMADRVLQRPQLKDYSEDLHAHGNTGATETIDLENGNVHSITLDANTTLTFSNPPATGDAGSFTLIVLQDATGSRTITWPAAVKWAGGTAPTLTTTASRYDVFTFVTVDGGTRWFGFVGGQNFQ